MQVSDDILDDLSKILVRIYSKAYHIERVCFFRGNVGLYDGEQFVVFFSKKYIHNTFNIDLSNSKRDVDDLDLFDLIQQEKVNRIKLYGVL